MALSQLKNARVVNVVYFLGKNAILKCVKKKKNKPVSIKKHTSVFNTLR